MKLTETEISHLLKGFTQIGRLLSTEKDHNRLLELILMKAQEFGYADGGTIYTRTDNNKLKFEIMINKSMGIHLGGTSKNKIPFEELSLYDEEGKPNKHMLAPWAAVSGKTINIKDAYTNKTFDLSGTKNFDKNTGYHSQSFLTVPLTNHLNEVIGVLQLLNSIDKKTKKVIPFSKFTQKIIESLASQAAVTLTNRNLIDSQRKLFDALIKLIAIAIDEKSPYTAGHCKRVPVITRMIAESACKINKGPLKDFKMSDDELYELEVAAWLHDCGKITTPEAVVDKATKLEGIFDNINLVDMRFEVLKRDETIKVLINKIIQLQNKAFKLEDEKDLQEVIKKLNTERDFIRECNIGGEVMHAEQINKINNIASHHIVNPQGLEVPLLSEIEIEMLGIYRGTLSNDERQKINNHVSVTIKLLESLPYPKNLKNVPTLAGSHHEKMDGTGYPRGLKREQLSIPARMIAIADIFEALTANDRPYKKSMPIHKALTILGQMKLDGHIDPDLFDVFINDKIYKKYAKQYLNIDDEEIDLKSIPGYKQL